MAVVGWRGKALTMGRLSWQFVTTSRAHRRSWPSKAHVVPRMGVANRWKGWKSSRLCPAPRWKRRGGGRAARASKCRTVALHQVGARPMARRGHLKGHQTALERAPKCSQKNYCRSVFPDCRPVDRRCRAKSSRWGAAIRRRYKDWSMRRPVGGVTTRHDGGCDVRHVGCGAGHTDWRCRRHRCRHALAAGSTRCRQWRGYHDHGDGDGGGEQSRRGQQRRDGRHWRRYRQPRSARA